MEGKCMKKIFQCGHCGVSIRDRKCFVLHLNRIHPTDPKVKDSLIKCNLCESYFKTKNSLAVHNGKVHNELIATRIQCAECGIIISKKSYSKHLNIHRGKKYECTICNKSFHQKNKLKDHLFNCHSDPKNEYVCELCGRRFNAKDYLARHVAQHHPNNVVLREGSFQCQYCKIYFRSEASVQVHVIAKHTAEAEVPVQRDVLSEAIRKSNIDLNPIVPVSETENKDRASLLKCKMCSKTFQKFYNLKRHHLRTHTNENSFKCPMCNLRFKYSSLLRRHLKQQHEIKCKTNRNSVMLSKINDLMSDIFSRKNGNVIKIKKSARITKNDDDLENIQSNYKNTDSSITDIVETNKILLGLSMPVIDEESRNSTSDAVQSNLKSVSFETFNDRSQVPDRVVNTSTPKEPTDTSIIQNATETVGVKTVHKDAVLGQANTEALFNVINTDYNRKNRTNDVNSQVHNFQRNIQSFIDEEINTVSLLSGCDTAEYTLVDPTQLNIIQVSDMINNNAKNNGMNKSEDNDINISTKILNNKEEKNAHENVSHNSVAGFDNSVLLSDEDLNAKDLLIIDPTEENHENHNNLCTLQNLGHEVQIICTEISNHFQVEGKYIDENHKSKAHNISEYTLGQPTNILSKTVQIHIPENDVTKHYTVNDSPMEFHTKIVNNYKHVQPEASVNKIKETDIIKQPSTNYKKCTLSSKHPNIVNVDELLHLNHINCQINLRDSQIHKQKPSDIENQVSETLKECATVYQNYDLVDTHRDMFIGDEITKVDEIFETQNTSSQNHIDLKPIAGDIKTGVTNANKCTMDYQEGDLFCKDQNIFNVNELINLNNNKAEKSTETRENLELSFDIDDLPLETSITDISLTQINVTDPSNDSIGNTKEFVDNMTTVDRVVASGTTKECNHLHEKQSLIRKEIHNSNDDSEINFLPTHKIQSEINDHENFIDEFQQISFTPTTVCIDNNTFIESIDAELVNIENICPLYGQPQDISTNDYFNNKSTPISFNFMNCSKPSQNSDIQIQIESEKSEYTNIANLAVEPKIYPNLENNLPKEDSLSIDELTCVQDYMQEISEDSPFKNIISSYVIDSEIPTDKTINEKTIQPEEIPKLLSACRLIARDYPHKCGICRSSFLNRSDLKKHEIIHSERPKFACHICGKTLTRKGLKQHEIQHEMKFTLKCLHCKKVLAPASIRLHNCVGRKGQYQCPVCHESFKYGSSKKNHIMNVHVFNKKTEKLMNNKHEADTLVGMIEDINEVTETENVQQLPDATVEVKKPRRKVQRRPKTLYHCHECGQQFQRRAHLEQHESIHSKVKGFTCECGTAFTLAKSLKKHKLKYNNQPHKSFNRCYDCTETIKH